MHADSFRSDLEQIPISLEQLATAIDDCALDWGITSAPRRLLLTGMGSSYFAADVCAGACARLASTPSPSWHRWRRAGHRHQPSRWWRSRPAGSHPRRSVPWSRISARAG